MGVWPKVLPESSPLSGSEGDLVSISISVDPRQLESLLDALARVSFPINPQIYHDAAIVYKLADGRESSEHTTLVEFPAYDSRMDEIRQALAASGFGADSARVAGMLGELQDCGRDEVAPAGAAYVSRRRVRRRSRLVH